MVNQESIDGMVNDMNRVAGHGQHLGENKMMTWKEVLEEIFEANKINGKREPLEIEVVKDQFVEYIRDEKTTWDQYHEMMKEQYPEG